MKRRFEKLIRENPKVLRRAVLATAESWVPLVVARTPRKTGRLQRSVKAKAMVSTKREDFRAALVAGGQLAPHARIVHETHKTKSKFLERVALEKVPTAGREIAARYDLGQAAQA